MVFQKTRIVDGKKVEVKGAFYMPLEYSEDTADDGNVFPKYRGSSAKRSFSISKRLYDDQGQLVKKLFIDIRDIGGFDAGF
jgi:hypothetical protein